jgi:hypothetical protein
MGTIAAIVGAIGGLCAVLGIITATELLEPLGEQFTWLFWFSLSVILLLASIVFLGGRGQSYD